MAGSHSFDRYFFEEPTGAFEPSANKLKAVYSEAIKVLLLLKFSR